MRMCYSPVNQLMSIGCNSKIFDEVIEYRGASPKDDHPTVYIDVCKVVSDLINVAAELGTIRTINDESIGEISDLLEGLQLEISGDISGSSSLLCRLVNALLNGSGPIPTALKASGGLLTHIDNKDPLLKMAKAGLGMIWSSVRAAEVDPSPATENTIIIFVLGGVSYTEIRQLSHLFENPTRESCAKKVVLISNKIIGPDELFDAICCISK